jgi:anti-anti-sigma regulatory factor
MFSSDIRQTGDVVELSIMGELVEESFNLDNILKDCKGLSRLRCLCSGITRINSVGVKSWIVHFRNLKKKNISYVLVDCSLSIVEQLNLMGASFVDGGKIESILAPFMCSSCSRAFSVKFGKEELKKLQASGAQIPRHPCPHCHSAATTFDDLPDYFSFLGHVALED